MLNKKGKWFKIARQPEWCRCDSYNNNDYGNYVLKAGRKTTDCINGAWHFDMGGKLTICEKGFSGATGLKLKPCEIAEFRLEMRRNKK